MKLDHQLTPYRKRNSRWTLFKTLKDLNIRCDTIKVLEKNIGRINFRHSTQQEFHRSVPWSKGHKGKSKQMGLHQIKSFCMAKENRIKIKREITVWENIFANDTSDKGLISKIYKELT